MSISIHERRREEAPTSVRPEGERRRKRQKDAHDVLQDRKAAGPERRVRVAQSTITFANVPGAECASCGRENFTWVTKCATCGAPAVPRA